MLGSQFEMVWTMYMIQMYGHVYILFTVILISYWA